MLSFPSRHLSHRPHRVWYKPHVESSVERRFWHAPRRLSSTTHTKHTILSYTIPYIMHAFFGLLMMCYVHFHFHFHFELVVLLLLFDIIF